eukprot:TRINITY_DN1730_c0_g1_i2.p2 TRINITY_DN1730_c0_g1~~TRINITY_DN1730_c0_g1_i2.p2  ORF type:complete len:387 (+),score=39.71 TRINITY_DN1730_c0_g1_i2:83-1162(+)
MTSALCVVLVLLSCAAVRGNYLSQYYHSDSSCSGNAIGWLGIPMGNDGCVALPSGQSMFRTCSGSMGYKYICTDNACTTGCSQTGSQPLSACVVAGPMWQTWTCSASPTVPSQLAPAVAFYPTADCSGHPALYLASTGACEQAGANSYLYYARASGGYVVKSGCNDGTCGVCRSEYTLNGDNQCQASPSGAGLAFPYYRLDMPAPLEEPLSDGDIVGIVVGAVAVVVVAGLVTGVICARRRRAQAAANYEQLSNLTLDDGRTASTFEQQLVPPAASKSTPPTSTPPPAQLGWQFERCSSQQPCSKAGCKFFMKRHPQDGGIHCNIAGCANFMTWHVGPCQSKFGHFSPAGGWDGQTYTS